MPVRSHLQSVININDGHSRYWLFVNISVLGLWYCDFVILDSTPLFSLVAFRQHLFWSAFKSSAIRSGHIYRYVIITFFACFDGFLSHFQQYFSYIVAVTITFMMHSYMMTFIIYINNTVIKLSIYFTSHMRIVEILYTLFLCNLVYL